jgi:predicted enzyme related to lactoylglutathione lyase
MTEPTTRLGRPVWVDLASTDADAARVFYTAVLGWSLEVEPDPQYGGYAMARVDGHDVAGIGPAQPGAPTAWSVYFLTRDAAALGERAAAAGGTVVMPAMPIGDVGRMAVLHDPAGAYFGVWEPRTMRGFHTALPGSFGWAELNARGVDRDLDFYQSLFGWDVSPAPIPGGVYTRLELDGEQFGGAMEMSADFPPDMPSYWLVYFAVDSADATVARATAAGGSVIVPAMSMPRGRFAILRDPQDGVFAVLSGE